MKRKKRMGFKGIAQGKGVTVFRKIDKATCSPCTKFFKDAKTGEYICFESAEDCPKEEVS